MAESAHQSEMKREEVLHMTDEEKAELDEMIKQGESWCVAEDVVTQSVAVVAKNEGLQDNEVSSQDMTVLVGLLKNRTSGPLDLCYSDHTGYIVKPFPNPLTDLDQFIQSSLRSEGVGGMVAYTGKNCRGDPCFWFLAWLDSEADGLKIYAECGLDYKFKKVDHVKPKFDYTRSATTYYYDPETGTSVAGLIDSSNGIDFLVATFAG